MKLLIYCDYAMTKNLYKIPHTFHYLLPWHCTGIAFMH